MIVVLEKEGGSLDRDTWPKRACQWKEKKPKVKFAEGMNVVESLIKNKIEKGNDIIYLMYCR